MCCSDANEGTVSYEGLILNKVDRVARVTLCRPEKMNPMDTRLIGELRSVIDDVRGDLSIKALVITGQDKVFSAGGDLSLLVESFKDWKILVNFGDEMNNMRMALEGLPVPTIALVNGYALAGGMELLLSCDLAIAAEEAIIGDQHINYGLVGGSSTWQLPRRIGLQKALYLMFTGGRVSGKEAEEIGIVYKAVPKEQLEPELEKLLSQIRDRSRDALGYIKKAAKGSLTMPMKDAFDYALMTCNQYFMTSGDARRGIQAFLGKEGPPKY